ncbi:diaminopimelate decarboxylase [Streptomyces griseocarneus]|uniref:diaminopimelate decarboxylase n=1 Tax=Streptomyces griseocarneus TaxID=51201 RepID=UPI00167DF6AA|nr:diaminopimelate decarboxylase [Streptomyces griseocarneus]MBZ6476040.1 diaminopimelate decarboxylase [Streptomyces griseocarneus]GHG77270.1 diaminopimelate decarboxylase [Streptomyces griseocarneus]
MGLGEGAGGAWRDAAVREAVRQGLVTAERPVAGLLDVRAVRGAAAGLRAAFGGGEVLHAFAVKAAPLVPVLRLLADEGLGAEVASPGELALARAAGVPAERIVLDSPAKTVAELREALALGLAVNADSREELARLDALLAAPGAPRDAAVGIRVNPQVGGGSIGALSTATETSKFGVPLRDEGARRWLVRAYAERPWLTRIHAHVGSQGCPLELMAAGVRDTYELAEEVNRAVGGRRIRTVDIGGGLPVNFASDDVTPTHHDYARLLAARVPGLFDGRYGLVTEFGRSLLAKSGLILARVEYTKSAGGRRIAIAHAGAQVAVRTVFAPESWPLRVAVYDARGLPKGADAVPQDVAGPCCFAGDLVAVDRMLPRIEAGDHVALLDTGAYYFSNHYAYNTLPRPGVYGYAGGQQADGTPDVVAGVRFATVRPPQTLDELVAEGGAARVADLSALR